MHRFNAACNSALLLLTLALFSACTEQPTGRDFSDPTTAAAAPSAMPANTAPAAPESEAAQAREAFARAQMRKPELTGQAFQDARKKLQPGMHFAFAIEHTQPGATWQGRGKTNGRSWFYDWQSADPGFSGEWLVAGNSALTRAKAGADFAKRAFQPEIHIALQQLLANIPLDEKALQRAPDDFAAGRVCAVYTLKGAEGTVKLWLDEKHSEFRKITLQQAPNRELSLDLNDINSPQFLPTVSVNPPR